MSDPDPNSPSEADELDRLLHARLRGTTQEFEARFDDLRRRLAHESSGARRRSWFTAWLTVRSTWAGAAIVGCVLALFAYRTAHQVPLPGPEIAAYGELLVLNDTLRAALPLTDSETLDAVLELPVAPRG